MKTIFTNRVIRGGKAGRGRSQIVRPPRAADETLSRDLVKGRFERLAPVLRECEKPETVWLWILKIEDLFRELRPGMGVRVTYAMLKLRGPAYSWWQTVEIKLGKWKALDIGWIEFKRRLMKAFGVEGYERRLMRDFTTFRMHWLSIEEYTGEFRRMLSLVRHRVRTHREEVMYYTKGLPPKYADYVGKQRYLDSAALCAWEIAHHEVPRSAKAEEAERVREVNRLAGKLGTDECPRCGRRCSFSYDCTCLDLECDVCEDWRHTASRCPIKMEY